MVVNLTLRIPTGRPLTYEETDDNFNNLKNAIEAVEVRATDLENGMDESGAFAASMEALRDEAEADAAAVAADKIIVAADKAVVAADKAAAAASAVSADTSADSALIASLASNYYPAAQTNVPRGIVLGAVAVTAAGSGGTNGTFALAPVGGNFAVPPVGTFTVSGNTLASINITSPGLYVGSSPTAPTLPAAAFAASAGLTGATGAALTVDFRVLSGEYYWTDHASDVSLVAMYYRSGSSAVISVGPDGGPITHPKKNYFELLGTTTFGRTTPAAQTAWNGTLYILPDEMVSPGTGYLSTFTAHGSNAGILTVQVVRQFNDGAEKIQVLQSKDFVVAAGAATVNPDLPWNPGEKIVYRHTGLPHYGGTAAADPGVYYSSVPYTSAASGTAIGTVNAGLTMQAKAVWSGETKGKSDAAETFVDAYDDTLPLMMVALGHDKQGYNLIEDNSLGEHRIFAGVNMNAGATYTFECLLPKGVKAWIFNNTGAQLDAIIDTDARTNVPGTAGYTTSGELTFEAVGSDFFKATVAGTNAGGETTGNIQIRLVRLANGQYQGDDASNIWVKKVSWKMAGSPTNQIPEDLTSSLWTRNGLKPVVSGTVPSLTSMAQKLENTALAPHPVSGEDVTFIGTSLVAQGLMTAAFASQTGAIVQALGSSGGALGLDARGSPHYGSGAITALFPSINVSAKRIILDMCVNDIAASDVPLGSVSDTTTATYAGALANFFIWCEANRPTATVHVVIPTAASATYGVSDYRHNVPNANGNTVEDFQVMTRRMARLYGRTFIDPNDWGISFQDAGDNTGDGLHWDTSGALAVAKVMAGHFRELRTYGVI